MPIEQSILKSTKKKLNVAPDDTSFDVDIIDHINSALTHLHQLGVGPQIGFQIEDDSATWLQFIPGDEDLPLRNAVKTNVFLQVRGLFDPPTLQTVASALEKQLEESYFRISVIREENEWIDPDESRLMVIDGGTPASE